MLERIQVKGFKSIREMDIELRPLNVLIGANGSGKSNFLEVFRFLNQIVEGRLNSYVKQAGGAKNILHYGRKHTSEIWINLTFTEGSYTVRLLPTDYDNLVVETEPLATSPEILSILQTINIYHFHDTSRESPIKTTSSLRDMRFLRHDGANLAAFLYWMKQHEAQHYTRIRNLIRLEIPDFEDFVLLPEPENPETIRLEWQAKGADQPFNANMLSDGSLRYICLATLLLQPQLPPLILIDEPEIGLNPHSLVRLIAMLQSAATKTQLIVATHSQKILDAVELDQVIVAHWEYLTKKFQFYKLNQEELAGWLEDYPLSNLWERNYIGGLP